MGNMTVWGRGCEANSVLTFLSLTGVADGDMRHLTWLAGSSVLCLVAGALKGPPLITDLNGWWWSGAALFAVVTVVEGVPGVVPAVVEAAAVVGGVVFAGVAAVVVVAAAVAVSGPRVTELWAVEVAVTTTSLT